MDAIVNVALPIFAVIALGFLSGRMKVLGPDSAEALNRFVFFVALPPAMFIFTARAEIGEILNGPFMLAMGLGMALTAAIAMAAGRLLFRTDAARSCFHGFNAIFGNYGYMGIPFFLAAFGPAGVLPPIVAGLVAGIPPMMLIMVAQEVLRSDKASWRSVWQAVWRVVARNLFLVATVLGVVFAYWRIPVPVPLGNLLDMLALAAGPTALFALGLSLVGQPILGDIREVALMTFMKMAVHPAVTFLIVTQVSGMDPFWAMSAVLLTAMPLGSSAFVLAQQYGVAVRVTSATVAISTVVAIVTLTGLMAAYAGIAPPG